MPLPVLRIIVIITLLYVLATEVGKQIFCRSRGPSR